MTLTDQQEQAASAKDGSTVVIACPGSGKTLVAAERIKRLIASGQTWDSHVAVTFTKRAAGELLSRIGGKLGYCGTIHGLAHEILLRSTGLEGGMRAGFIVWDDDTRAGRLKALVEYHRLKTTPEKVAAYLDARHVGRGLPAGEWTAGWAAEQDCAGAYGSLKSLCNAEDWNGLIDRARAVLTSNPGFLRELQDRWRHVTVDEYQDVDRMQDDLISILWPLGSFRYGDPARSLFAVGDPMQAIYGWRGGDPWLLEERARLCGRFLRLHVNFRCGIDLSRALERISRRTMVEAGLPGSIIAYRAAGPPDDHPFPHAVLCRTNAEVDRLLGEMPFYRLSDDEAPKTGGTVVGTIHLAKGLEWDCVVLPGWTEGLFPSQQAIEAEAKRDPEPMEAERRLAYVAVSRAKRHVVILSPPRFRRGPWDHEGASGEPSRFIAEMGLEVVQGDA